MTLVQKEIKAVYLWTTKVRPSQPFTPWANTLVYFPFESDALDHSWNWHTLNTSWTQESIWRRFNTQVTYTSTINQLANFVSFRMKIYNYWGWWRWQCNQVDIFANKWYLSYVAYNWWISTTTTYDKVRFVYNSSWDEYSYGLNSSTWQWYHIAMCYSNPWWAWCFINGSKYQFTTSTNSYSETLPVSNATFISNWGNTKLDVALSDVIAETTARSDADVLAYFNATKSKYWVS